MGPCGPQGRKDAPVLVHVARPWARGGLLALASGTEAWMPEWSLCAPVCGGLWPRGEAPGGWQRLALCVAGSAPLTAAY